MQQENRLNKWQQFITDPNTSRELESYALNWLNNTANTNISFLNLIFYLLNLKPQYIINLALLNLIPINKFAIKICFIKF